MRCALLFFILSHLVSFARPVEFTLFHTTDIHGHIFPSEDYKGRNNLGGILRIATALEAERAKVEHHLSIDCGDFFQGSPRSMMTKGALVMECMSFLDYDAVIIGNHEFDLGWSFLNKLMGKYPLPFLAADIRYEGEGSHPLKHLKPYVLKEVDGIKIAIVGLSTPGMPTWFRPEYLGDLVFESAVDCLKKVLPKVLLEKPDIIIVGAHQGYPAYGRQRIANHIKEIAFNFPEVDILIGGHTHKVIAIDSVNNIPYAQAGYHGIWLGRMDIVYDNVQKKVLSCEGQLIEMNAGVAEHPKLKKRLSKLLKTTDLKLAKVIVKNSSGFSPTDKYPGVSEIQQLISTSLADAVASDFVIHGLLNDKASLPKGAVVEEDLWEVIPYENQIGTLQLRPLEIRTILEENLSLYGKYSFKGPWGFSYTFDRSKPAGKRVYNLKDENGRALKSQKRYSVAFNSYDLSSSGGRLPSLRAIADDPLSRVKMTGVNSRDALRAYLKKHPNITLDLAPLAVEIKNK